MNDAISEKPLKALGSDWALNISAMGCRFPSDHSIRACPAGRVVEETLPRGLSPAQGGDGPPVRQAKRVRQAPPLPTHPHHGRNQRSPSRNRRSPWSGNRAHVRRRNRAHHGPEPSQGEGGGPAGRGQDYCRKGVSLVVLTTRRWVHFCPCSVRVRACPSQSSSGPPGFRTGGPLFTATYPRGTRPQDGCSGAHNPKVAS